MSGEVMNLLLEEIDVSSSHRAVNVETVERLAASIKEIGLQHPITVRSNKANARFDLIAGRHRLEACRAAKLDRLPCKIVKMDDTEARMWEISENLHRAELSVMDRSEQIAEYSELVKRRREAERAVFHVKHENAKGDGTVRATAKDLGVNPAEVHKARQIASLSPDAKAAAVQHGIENSTRRLLEVAKAPAAEQVAKVAELAAKPVKLAPEPLNEFETREQWMGYMMRGWNRAPLAWREAFFERVDGTIFDAAGVA